MGQENIPETVLKLAERGDIFRQYTSNLNSSVVWYNKIKNSSKEVEFQLVEDDIEEIDKLIVIGQKELHWESQSTSLNTSFTYT